MLKTLSVSATAVLVVLAGCQTKPSLPDYRYRMTVEVETPEGLKSGSSVIEVSSSIASKDAFPMPNKVSTQVHGEAVAVDLGKGRVLFALLNKRGLAEGANNYAFDALFTKPWAGADEYLREVNELVTRRDIGVLPPHDPHLDMKSYKSGVDTVVRSGPIPKELLFQKYPMLVTFSDLRDPRSVLPVDPADFAKAFGSGVVLKRITVQPTDAPVTTGIDKRLAAMGLRIDHGLDDDFAPTTKPTLAQQLGYRNFKS